MVFPSALVRLHSTARSGCPGPCFKEAEAEIDGAPDYVERLNGNELTRLLDETAKHTDRQLQ